MEKLNQLKEMLESMSEDVTKFYEKEQNAAGTRLRKTLMEIRKLSQDIRKEISDIRADRKK